MAKVNQDKPVDQSSTEEVVEVDQSSTEEVVEVDQSSTEEVVEVDQSSTEGLCYRVATGKAITTKRGVKGEGEIIDHSDLHGGEDTFNDLQKRGLIVKG